MPSQVLQRDPRLLADPGRRPLTSTSPQVQRIANSVFGYRSIRTGDTIDFAGVRQQTSRHLITGNMATTFHLFPFLPFELRVLWELTVEPRMVEVRALHTTISTTELVPRSECRPWRGMKEVSHVVSVPRVTSPTMVPAALQTCQEARNMGLYQRAFAELSPEEPRYVWLNLDIDMVSIRSDPFKWFKPVSHLVRRLRFEREIG